MQGTECQPTQEETELTRPQLCGDFTDAYVVVTVAFYVRTNSKRGGKWQGGDCT